MVERVTGTPVAVLYLDLDNLKTINDNLGHEGGDHLLQTVSARISGCLRPEDTVARNISLERLQVSLELVGSAAHRLAGPSR